MVSQCQGCGGTVVCTPKAKPRKWCTESCRQAYYRRGDGSQQANRPLARHCATCGETFTPGQWRSKYCTSRCGDIARGMTRPDRPAVRACPMCLETFAPTSHRQVHCSALCRDRWATKLKRDQGDRSSWRPDYRSPSQRAISRRKKAKRRGAVLGDPVDPLVIYERDEWVCWLCSKPVDSTLRYPDRQSASVDHVIPIALGGLDDPSNVRLAHLGCNCRRGSRMDPVYAELASVTPQNDRAIDRA